MELTRAKKEQTRAKWSLQELTRVFEHFRAKSNIVGRGAFIMN